MSDEADKADIQKDVSVHREEIYERIQADKAKAVQS